MLKVHYTTLQKILDILPARSGLGMEVDTFLAELKTRGEDAITLITAHSADSANVAIKVVKDKIDV